MRRPVTGVAASILLVGACSDSTGKSSLDPLEPTESDAAVTAADPATLAVDPSTCVGYIPEGEDQGDEANEPLTGRSYGYAAYEGLPSSMSIEGTLDGRELPPAADDPTTFIDLAGATSNAPHPRHHGISRYLTVPVYMELELESWRALDEHPVTTVVLYVNFLKSESDPYWTPPWDSEIGGLTGAYAVYADDTIVVSGRNDMDRCEAMKRIAHATAEQASGAGSDELPLADFISDMAKQGEVTAYLHNWVQP